MFMKKVLLLLLLTGITVSVFAQVPQAKPKANAPVIKKDTIKRQDNMPVAKPKGNSPMPVAKPIDDAPMPVLNPDANKTRPDSKPAPKPQKR